MFEAFYGAFKREIESVRGSFYRVGLLTFFPLLSFALVVAIFYKGIAYEMPVIAVDLDKTPLSRDLLFEVDASATINIKYRLNNLAEAKRVIKSSIYHDSIKVQDFSAEAIVSGMQKIFDRFIENISRQISGF